MDLSAILSEHYGNKTWQMVGNSYSGLSWYDETPQPTEADLTALWPQTQYQIAYKAVEKNRADQYREISDPIFFQYQRGTKTEQEWLDAVQAIKDANPYPVLESEAEVS